MSNIIIPVVIVAAIGLIAGFGLAIASKLMAIPVDEKEQAILDVLPGANCGGCGFSGCSGYAAALAKGGDTPINLCGPGGSDVAKKISEILGVAADTTSKKAAVVACAGTCDNAVTKYDYAGVDTCYAQMQLGGGSKACPSGCLGLGDCAAVCEYDAIEICSGIAHINRDLCVACGKCAKKCPKGLIQLVPFHAAEPSMVVVCSGSQKGAQTKKDCKVGCIGCMRCQKICESGAITVANNHASIDYEKCTHCGKCIDVCLQGCIARLAV